MLFQFQQTGTTKLIIKMTKLHSLVYLPSVPFSLGILVEVLSVLLFLFPLTKIYLIKYSMLCQSWLTDLWLQIMYKSQQNRPVLVWNSWQTSSLWTFILPQLVDPKQFFKGENSQIPSEKLYFLKSMCLLTSWWWSQICLSLKDWFRYTFF